MLSRLMILLRYRNIASSILCLYAIFCLSQFFHLQHEVADVNSVIKTRQLTSKTAKGLQCMKHIRHSPVEHPKAPVHFLPQGSAMLLPATAYATVCLESKEKLKLIMVLSRVGSVEMRNAMRQTFGRFNELNLKSNWSMLFLVSINYCFSQCKLWQTLNFFLPQVKTE